MNIFEQYKEARLIVDSLEPEIKDRLALLCRMIEQQAPTVLNINGANKEYHIEFCDKTFALQWSAYYRGEEESGILHNIPDKAFFDDNVLLEYIETMKQAKVRAEADRKKMLADRKKQEQIDDEKRTYKLFLELKEKYEKQ